MKPAPSYQEKVITVDVRTHNEGSPTGKERRLNKLDPQVMVEQIIKGKTPSLTDRIVRDYEDQIRAAIDGNQKPKLTPSKSQELTEQEQLEFSESANLAIHTVAEAEKKKLGLWEMVTNQQARNKWVLLNAVATESLSAGIKDMRKMMDSILNMPGLSPEVQAAMQRGTDQANRDAGAQ